MESTSQHKSAKAADKYFVINKDDDDNAIPAVTTQPDKYRGSELSFTPNLSGIKKNSHISGSRPVSGSDKVPLCLSKLCSHLPAFWKILAC